LKKKKQITGKLLFCVDFFVLFFQKKYFRPISTQINSIKEAGVQGRGSLSG